MRLILVLASALTLWTAPSALATVAQYEVRGVKANDKLNIRAAPTHTAKILGRIPPNGREIEIIGRGKGQWVKISYGRVQGYVNRTYLARSKARVAAAAQASSPAADPNDEAYTGPAPAALSAPVSPAVATDPSPPAPPAAMSAPNAPDEPPPAATLEMPPEKSAVVTDPAALEPEPETKTVEAAVAPPAPPEAKPPAASEPPKVEAPAKPATTLPGEKRPEGGSVGLVVPPNEFMNEPAEPVPARMTCGGREPAWTMTMGGGVTWFETPAGEKVQLALKALQTYAGRDNAWTATGRSASSKLNLQLVRTNNCSIGAGEQRSPYEVSLQLEDGRLMMGCCQAAKE